MPMKRFLEYIDKTDDDVAKRLRLVQKALERSGFRVKDFTSKDTDQHIFIYALPQLTTLEGIRMYLLGDILAFRVQKKVDTEPYGKAYTFAIQDMYDDMVLEYEKDKDHEKSIKKTIERMGEELSAFFQKTKDAEEEIVKVQLSDIVDKTQKPDGIIINTMGTDYASKVFTDTR